MKFKILIGLTLGLIATLANAASWQLPSGYFVPAKLPLTVVNPRPDSETANWARNRLAYPDGTMQYRVPVAIQGGAYPYHFELVSGPSGMSIGQDITDQDYGIVTWTPTTSGGPYTVSVKVTDQELNTTTATWTVTATTSGFVFVDPNAANGGDGSKAHPFNNTDAVFGSTPTSATYSGYQMIFRGGTTAMHGPESNGNVTLQNNNKPVVWLGYTGENATLDFSHLKALINTNQNDIWIEGLNIKNARTDVTDYHFFYFSTNSTNNRTVFFENNFSNIGYSNSANDPVNQACILMFNGGVLRNYFTFMGNSLDQFQASFIDIYATKYAVIENNKLLNGIAPSPEAAFYLKSDLQNITVRRNVSLSQSYGYGAIYIPQQAQIFSNANFEIAYNVMLSGDISKPIVRYEWMGSGQANNNNPQLYVYRNTFRGNIQGLDDFPYTVHLDNNVLVNSAGNYGDTTGNNRVVIPQNNLTATPGNNVIDLDGNLVGNGAQYRGTRGYEIFTGVNPLSAPSWN
ncbi:MAG: hypothetical protein GC149_17360 [Gammaproteobacteria bacterium]|nr:hypothetical protein [Gammaproteobacteria bacterium]